MSGTAGEGSSGAWNSSTKRLSRGFTPGIMPSARARGNFVRASVTLKKQTQTSRTFSVPRTRASSSSSSSSASSSSPSSSPSPTTKNSAALYTIPIFKEPELPAFLQQSLAENGAESADSSSSSSSSSCYPSFPVFLGGDGTLYDLYYLPYDPSKPHLGYMERQRPRSEREQRLMKAAQNLLSYLQQQKSDSNNLFLTFPKPEDPRFFTMFDYEQSLVDWKNEVARQLAHLQLPVVMGRYYHRPRVVMAAETAATMTEEEEEQPATQKTTKPTPPSPLTTASTPSPPLVSTGASVASESLTSPRTSLLRSNFLAASAAAAPSSASASSTPSTSSPASASASASPSATSVAQEQEKGGGASPEAEVLSSSQQQQQEQPPLIRYLSEPDLFRKLHQMDMAKKANGSLCDTLIQQRSQEVTQQQQTQQQTRGLMGQRHLSSFALPLASSTASFSASASSSGGEEEDPLQGFDSEVRKFTFKEDPWTAQLIMAEPRPEFYATFEEYEFAMKRWAHLVSTTLPLIPPHPSQLKTILSIPTAKEREAHQLQQQQSRKFRSRQRVKKEDESSPSTTPIDLKVRTVLVENVVEDPLYNNFVYAPTKPDDSNNNNGITIANKSSSSSSSSSSSANVTSDESSSSTSSSSSLASSGGGGGDREEKREEETLKEESVSSAALADSRAGHSSNKWFQLPSQAQAILTQQLDKVLQSRLNQRRMTKYYNKPVLPRIHGIFSPSNTWESSASFSMPIKKETIIELRAVRRPELTAKMIASCMDCPAQIGDRPVEFRLPVDDIGPLQFHKLLHGDRQYQHYWMNQLRIIHYTSRHDHLHSWYHPTLPPEVHQKHRQELDEIVERKAKERMSPSAFIRAMLVTPMFLEHFQDIFSEHTSKGEEELDQLVWGEGKVTFMQSLLNVMEPDTFASDVLPLFDECRSMLTRAKLSFLVAQVLQSNRSKTVLDYLLSTHDLRGLNHLAIAMIFFSEVPAVIWPYHRSTIELVRHVVKLQQQKQRQKGGSGEGDKELERFMNTLQDNIIAFFEYYYLKIVLERIRSQKFIYLSVFSFLEEKYKNALQTLCKSLEENSREFVLSCIIPGIGYHTARISLFWSFVLIQLMSDSSADIRNCLNSADIITHIRALCFSKFVHCQYVARRLFSILQSQTWEQSLYDYYRNSSDTLLRDLTALPRSLTSSSSPSASSPNIPEDIPSSLIAILTFELCKSVLADKLLNVLSYGNNNSPATTTSSMIERYSFLLNESVMKQLLEAVVVVNSSSSTSSVSLRQSTEMITELLADMTQVLYKLGLLVMTADNDKKADKKVTTTAMLTSGNPVVLNFSDIGKILAFMQRITSSSERAYAVKSHLLRVLQSFMKLPGTFAYAKKNGVFYPLLAESCKDGSHMAFNKNAWKVFYLVIVHHTGVMDWLISNQKLMNQFLSVVGTASHNVAVINGLHYLRKLFLMVTNYQERQQQQMSQEEGQGSSASSSSSVPSGFGSGPVPGSPLHPQSPLQTSQLQKKQPFNSNASSSLNNHNPGGNNLGTSPNNNNCIKKKKDQWRKEEKDPLRTFEKDVKNLASHYVSRHMFVNVHMLYMRMKEGDPGASFQELARFYRAIVTNPSCAKILKNLKSSEKNVDYKKGLERMSKMFDVVEEQAPLVVHN
ncbi:Armadillo-like helical domain-containing protein [Balamuthia mandrillaris]